MLLVVPRNSLIAVLYFVHFKSMLRLQTLVRQLLGLPDLLRRPCIWCSSVAAYLSAACHQMEAVLTGIGLSHHRVSSREFLVQGNSTVLKIVLSQTSNGHINLEPPGLYAGLTKRGSNLWINVFVISNDVEVDGIW